MQDLFEDGRIGVFGANEHNLKNISIELPRNKLVVITGLSGSGKSSLAFDTIYAEGQRRYMETFAGYARQYIGDMKRPDVEKIDGLSPVISIEQKTAGNNPRSTVGTITEIYDFLRLLFARASDAYSYLSGEKMVRYSEEQLITALIERHQNNLVNIYAPLVRARKGHYRELFELYRKKGFTKVRVDNKLKELKPGLETGRFQTHNIEVLIDRINVESKNLERLKSSVRLALKEGKGSLLITNNDNPQTFYYSRNLVCPQTGLSYDEPQPNTFSFNSPYGACPACEGLGQSFLVDESVIITDPDKSIKEGGIFIPDPTRDNWTTAIINSLAARFDISLTMPVSEIPKEKMEKILFGASEEILVRTAFMDYEMKFEGLINRYKNILTNSESNYLKDAIKEVIPQIDCPECNGSRLKKEALYFKLNEKNIFELSSMQLNELSSWFEQLPKHLSGHKLQIADEVLKEINTRINFLIDIGLGYLSLQRKVGSLSGGEAQRIRLATQIGSQLINVTYIIDEPSIGLHQRDNHRLINSLKNLAEIGNSVIVVEHDKEMMQSADFIVDLGPKAGINGGNLIASGTFDEIKKSAGITSDYLSGNKSIEIPDSRRQGNGLYLELFNASGHNLKNVNLKIPLGKLICVTGVSGSGKSSLINQTLYPILKNHFYRTKHPVLPYGEIRGIENIDKVIEIDQQPIGRTPRSNPATYTNVFSLIRNLFVQLPEAKIRGYKPGRFSFNVKGGRCEECEGAGEKTIEMNFLPDVAIPCMKCMGKRYNRETLEVRYRGKSINDVLNMSHLEAVEFFSNIPQIKRKLKTMVDVGLGYITLGQSSVTVSGGEAQRVKLATELAKKDTGKTFYILDEPTTGLHFEDIRILMNVLNRFVDHGNTVLIIEHNLDVIKLADYIIDMGPEGGEAGGQIVCKGTPEEIIKNKCGHTAFFLERELLSD